MKIYVINSQDALKISKPQVKKIVNTVLRLEDKQYDEVTIHFIDPIRICELHGEFFNDHSLTDCISFPMDDETQEGYRVLGEIFVCPQTAINYSLKHHRDPYQETTLYIVHGLLHLLGYDDLDKNKKRQMRTAEKRHMQHLQELNFMLFI